MGRPPLPPPGTRAPGGGPSAARPPGPAGHRAVLAGPVLRCCPPGGPGVPAPLPAWVLTTPASVKTLPS